MPIKYLGDDTFEWTKRGRTAVRWVQLRLFDAALSSSVVRMTKPKGTTQATSTLTAFDGQNVIAATIAVTGAGDGLSAAMSVAPREFHMGDTVDVVLRCKVASVKLVPENRDHPDGDLVRQHTLKAGLATIVDAPLVNDVLAAQKRKLDEAKGIQGLDAEVGETWGE